MLPLGDVAFLMRCFFCGFLQCIKALFYDTRFYATGDKNNFGSMIVARPFGQPNGIMEDMLHAVNSDGLFFIEDIDDPLYA